jgi:hypothetical protein
MYFQFLFTVFDLSGMATGKLLIKMKTLNLYVLKNFLITFGMAIGVLTFVVFQIPYCLRNFPGGIPVTCLKRRAK